MEFLEAYYNERIKCEASPSYPELTAEEKKVLSKTYEYAFYVLDERLKDLKQKIIQSVCKK